MYIPLVGWHIAGWPGALATLAATLLPSATLTLGVSFLYKRHPQAAFGLAIRRGLAPITIGLVFASGWILLPAVAHDWRGYVLTAVTIGVVLRTSLNPLWVLIGGAIAGMTGLV
jgi:chromate transporter